MELSIIIPVFNVEDYLETCLESIYRIKDIKKEVIIINDGSTDNSKDVIEDYRKRYSSITKVINQENKGLSGARNAGIKIASGEYVSFIDSDDFIDSDKYFELFDQGKNMELDIIFGDLIYYDRLQKNITNRMKARSQKLSSLVICEGLKFWEKCLEKNNDSIRVEVVTNFYRRSLLIKNNLLFQEKLLHEDTLFMYLATYYAKRVKYFPSFFYYYRTREGSIMSTVGYDNHIHKLYIAQELDKFKEEHGIVNQSWDTLIVALYFGALRSYKISNKKLYEKVKNTSELTKLSKLKLKIIPLLHIISIEVEIDIT